MKRNRSIQIKAAFLMIVFSLNTIVGFACAIGFKKWLASSDHHNITESKAVVHVHADGKKHIHHKPEESKAVVHVHADGKKHIHHNETATHEEKELNTQNYIQNQHNPQEEKSKCCTTKVTEFEQLDKCIPQSKKFNPVFFSTTIINFFNIDILYTSYINANIKYFVRSYHPPIPNIRIAIQSFQV